MLKNERINKNFLFFSISTIGVAYFAILLSLGRSFFQSCLYAISKVVDITSGNNLWLVMSEQDLFVSFLGFLFFLFLILKIVLAIFLTIQKIILSEYKIKHLKLTRNDDYFIADSDEYFAFTYGYLKPIIVVSKKVFEEFSAQELGAILSHESAHKSSYDNLREIWIGFLEKSVFMIFRFTFLIEKYRQSVELTADKNAQDKSGQKALIGSLYKMISHPNHLIAGVGFASASERIMVLTGKRRRKFVFLFLSTLLTIGLLFFSSNLLASADAFNQCKEYSFCVEGENNHSCEVYEVSQGEVMSKSYLNGERLEQSKNISKFE